MQAYKAIKNSTKRLSNAKFTLDIVLDVIGLNGTVSSLTKVAAFLLAGQSNLESFS